MPEGNTENFWCENSENNKKSYWTFEERILDYLKDKYISAEESEGIIKAVTEEREEIKKLSMDKIDELHDMIAENVWIVDDNMYDKIEDGVLLSRLKELSNPLLFTKEENIKSILEEKPELILINARLFIHKPWGEKYIYMAAQNNKKTALRFADKYLEKVLSIDKNKWLNLMHSAVEENRWGSLKFADSYLDIVLKNDNNKERWLESIEKSVKIEKTQALYRLWEYIDIIARYDDNIQRWCDIIKEIFVNEEEDYSFKFIWALFNVLPRNESNKLIWKNIMTDFMNKNKEYASTFIGWYIAELVDFTWEKDYWLNLLLAFNYYDLKNLSYAPEDNYKAILKAFSTEWILLIEKIVEWEPLNAFQDADHYLPQVFSFDKDKWIEIVEKLLAKSPDNIIEYSWKYIPLVLKYDTENKEKWLNILYERSALIISKYDLIKANDTEEYDEDEDVELEEDYESDDEEMMSELEELPETDELFHILTSSDWYLEHVLQNDNNKERWLNVIEKVINKILEEWYPDDIVDILDRFLGTILKHDKENKNKWIHIARNVIQESDPNYALEHLNIFLPIIIWEDKTVWIEILNWLINKADPEAVIIYYQNIYDIHACEQEAALSIIEKAIEAVPASAIKYINKYLENILKIDKERTFISLENAFKNYSFGVIKYSWKYLDILMKSDKERTTKIVEESFRDNYIYYYSSFGYSSTSKIKEIIENSNNETVIKIRELNNTIEELPLSWNDIKNVRYLFNSILSKRISIESALKIINEKWDYFRELITILSEDDPIWKTSSEIKLIKLSLLIVREINDRHEWEFADKRFDSVDKPKATTKELYTLMVYWEEEVFTSTFKWLFSRLIEQMKRENISWDQLLKDIWYNKYRTFIKICAWFNKLWEFLWTMSNSNQEELMSRFISWLEKEDNVESQSVAAADTIWMLEDSRILKSLADKIKSEFERTSVENNENWVVLYGLLVSIIWSKDAITDNWFNEKISEYEMKPLTNVWIDKLRNPDGTHVQQVFFYDDRKWTPPSNPQKEWDGHNSFKSFMYRYWVRVRWDKSWNIKDIPDGENKWWNVTDMWSYVTLSSKGKDGKDVLVYANKPDHDEKGPDEVSKELKEKKIKSIMIVHRGHSYHTQKTIDRIPSIAAIVSLWSCWWYNNVEAVLRKAPDAHILSTKWTGTMLVNDPLFKKINERIKNWEDVHWPTIWKEIYELLQNNLRNAIQSKDEAEIARAKWAIENYKDYVSPHKNLWVMFLKKYRDMKSSTG